MWQLFLIVTISGLLVSFSKAAEFASSPSGLNVPAQRRLMAVAARPELGKRGSGVGRLSVTTPKHRYRIGEVVNIEVTLVNFSEKPLFFRRVAAAHVRSRNKQGRKIEVSPYVLLESRLTPQSYVFLKHSETSSASYGLLVGCDERAFKEMNEFLGLERSNKSPEDNPFVKWGTSCLDVTKPGAYYLTFELNNDFVLVSLNQPVFETAVGTIRSKPLIINIGPEN